LMYYISSLDQCNESTGVETNCKECRRILPK
jgi:bacterioferritin-associated ferredoxin